MLKVKCKNPIIVWKLSQLGDTVSFLPTLKRIREIYKDNKIVVVVTPIGAELIEGMDLADEIWKFEFKKIKKLYLYPRVFLKLLIKIYRYKFCYAIFSYDELSFTYILSFLANIKNRIGYNLKIAKFQFLTTDKIEINNRDSVYEINNKIVNFIKPNHYKNIELVKIDYEENDWVVVKNILSQYMIVNPFIIIHPFSNYPYKEWALDNYFQLAAKIIQKYDIDIIILSKKRIKLNCFYEKIHFINSLTIKQVGCLLEQCQLYIGNNSGVMHVAAAQGTKSVILNGPSPDEWIIKQNPRIKNLRANAKHLSCLPCETFTKPFLRECINQNYPNGCMHEISLKEVYREVVSFLSSNFE